jgi:hypothetical protein
MVEECNCPATEPVKQLYRELPTETTIRKNLKQLYRELPTETTIRKNLERPLHLPSKVLERKLNTAAYLLIYMGAVCLANFNFLLIN